MSAAIILVMSLAALAHFGWYSWRMTVITLAAEPLSDRIRVAIPDNHLEEKDFRELSSFVQLCPDLDGHGKHLGLVRTYYLGLRTLDKLSSILLPAASSWTQKELVLCRRYVAVEIDQRLQRNQACLAEICSY